MKNRIFYIIIALMPVFYTGCKEEGRIDHIDGSAPAPAQVTDVTVRDIPGGAVLKYQLPDDENLLYVQAVYEIRPGVQRESKASCYEDSLLLDGFGEAGTFDVKLYSVGRNEKASPPLTVPINPTTPPVRLAIKELKSVFGGIGITIQNPAKTNLAIVLMGDTARLGYHTYMETFYTSNEFANFALRGLDTIPGDFSLYVRDRWNNMSDTIADTLTPMYEELISKNTWEEYTLPSDNNTELYDNNPIYGVSAIWDSGDFEGAMPVNNDALGYSIGTYYLGTEEVFPSWITWYLGKTVILSRLRFWHMWNYAWNDINVKAFELWGSMLPNPDGSWDESWVPLGRFEPVKPSPGTNITNEDIMYARSTGMDFDFAYTDFAPDPFVPVRYIRFKALGQIGGAPRARLYCQEISFWGQIVN